MGSILALTHRYYRTGNLGGLMNMIKSLFLYIIIVSIQNIVGLMLSPEQTYTR